MKRIIALLLIMLCLVISACSSSIPPKVDDPKEGDEPKVINKFSDIEFEYPDTATLEKDLNGLNNNLFSGRSDKMLIEEYRRLYDIMDDIYGQQSLLHVYTSMDMNNKDMSEKYERINSDICRISYYINRIGGKLCDREVFKDYFTEAEIREVKANAHMFSKTNIDDLNTRYNQLIAEYNKVAVSGISDDELTKSVGRIYIDMINVTKQVAPQCGFDSFEQMKFNIFMRDYTPDDSDKLADAVRKYLVPVYLENRDKLMDAYNREQNHKYSYEKSKPDIDKALSNYSSQLYEAWKYMNDHELIDMSTGPNRTNECYTTYFYQYDWPFILGHWYDGLNGVETIIHEFGHFNASYVKKSMDSNMDLSEIDSQALVLLLMSSQAETLCGSDHAQDARAHVMKYSIERLLERLVQNRLQKYAYSTDNLTVDMISQEYSRLLKEYGLSGIYGEDHWAQTYHTVCQPFYDISYTTSMLVSLQLWEMAQTDSDAARDKYLLVVNRQENVGFKEQLSVCGMDSPFEEETIKSVADAIKAFADKLK